MITLFVLTYLLGWFVCSMVVYRVFREKGDVEEEIMAGAMGFMVGFLWPIVLFAAFLRKLNNWLDTKLETQ